MKLVLFPLVILIILAALWLLGWWLLLCVGLGGSHRLHLRKRMGNAVEWVPSLQQDGYPQHSTGTLPPSFASSNDDTSLDMSTPRLRLPYRQQQTQPPQEQQQQAWSDAFPVLVSLKQTGPIQDMPTVVRTVENSRASDAVTMPRGLHMDIGVNWDKGITRKDMPNEDSLVVLQGTCICNELLVPFGLFIVADGMGGHSFGLQASRIAIRHITQTVLQNILKSDQLSDELLTAMLVESVELANRAIYQWSQVKGYDVGTTLTAALVIVGKAYIVNVGDSRTYRHDPQSGLLQITCDHSLVASLVAAGAITREEVYTHPDRHKIYRCLGNENKLDVDWFVIDLRSGDTLLLCSDGLWEMVRDQHIERILRRNSNAAQSANELLEVALKAGGQDNVSAIVVRMR
ncbi:MAG: serine/threonine-protein phosphatase [Chloroflexi bacterium]|nr:serine/threonine-protein phosphatase [Chloroflexota bacterium]